MFDSLDPTVAGLIWIGIGIPVVSIGLLLILEGILFLLRKPPITSYIRNWSRGHLYLAVFIGVALVALSSIALTHFVLDA